VAFSSRRVSEDQRINTQVDYMFSPRDLRVYVGEGMAWVEIRLDQVNNFTNTGLSDF
jgi:hypothetical protein